MRILGALVGISNLPLYGANVANRNLLKALIDHSSIDEIDLFYDSLSLMNAEEDIKEILRVDERASRIKLKNILSLPLSFRDVDYIAFHHGNPFWGRVANIRADSSVPLTGTAYAISYHFVLDDLIFNVLNARPFDSIICTSVSQKKAMEELLELVSENLRMLGFDGRYKGRLDLIPLGADTSLYRPRDKLDSRAQIDLPKDKLIILWVGRFSAYDKADLSPLLLVFKKVSERYPNIVLVLAADDKHGYSKKVKILSERLGITEKVIIRADPSITSLPLFYSSADIFVAPADNVQETFGLVVIEAMSSGIPVVVSDWDGYKELVVHGETGFKVPTYWAKCDGAICPVSPLSSWLVDHLYLGQSVCVDLGKMEEYLVALIENPDLRRRMGERGREHVVTNYDWKVVVRGYEDLWKELKEEAKGGKGEAKIGPSFEPQYFRVFKDYPTKILDDEDEIRLTEMGRGLLEGSSKTVEFYAEMGTLLDPGVMEEIVAKVGESEGWVRVGEIMKEVGEAHGIHSENVIYQIMWMMKYGVLETKEEEVKKDEGRRG